DPAQHGAVLTDAALGFLALGRDGLAETELLDLLSADAEVMADFRRRAPDSPDIDALPTVVWSRLYADVERLLVERRVLGARLIGFAHSQIRASVAARALTHGEDRIRRITLATYFARSAPLTPLQPGPSIDWRLIRELPWQLAAADQWEQLDEFLT